MLLLCITASCLSYDQYQLYLIRTGKRRQITSLSSAALAMTSLYKDSTVTIKHRCERFVQMKWRRRHRRPEVARAGRRWERSGRRRRPTTNTFLIAKNLPRFEPLTRSQFRELTSWDADFALKHLQCCGLDDIKFSWGPSQATNSKKCSYFCLNFNWLEFTNSISYTAPHLPILGVSVLEVF